MNHDLPPPPPAHVELQTFNFSSEFINFVKNLEWDNPPPVHIPYESVEGGPQTIGYGHKIRGSEHFTSLSDAQATRLLVQDLCRARERALNYVRSRFGAVAALSQKQQEMLTEFAFNLGGLEKFPKFTRAIVERDWAGASREYRRFYRSSTGKMVLLNRRNRLFAARYRLTL